MHMQSSKGAHHHAKLLYRHVNIQTHMQSCKRRSRHALHPGRPCKRSGRGFTCTHIHALLVHPHKEEEKKRKKNLTQHMSLEDEDVKHKVEALNYRDQLCNYIGHNVEGSVSPPSPIIFFPIEKREGERSS